MLVNDKGKDLIVKYESIQLKPYLCPAGIPTIGVGMTYYPHFKTKVTMKDAPLTKEQALQLFYMLLEEDFASPVRDMLSVKLNDNQFSALVSFAYNAGINNLRKSTLLEKVNINPEDPTIKDEFMKWVFAKKKKLNGLVKRREEEANLYFTK